MNNLIKSKISSVHIGILLIIIGIIILCIKALSGEYIDPTGILHEYFFLIPIAYIFSLSGIVVLIVTAIKKI